MARLELWRWIPGYEGRYQVSTLGSVRSFVKGPPVVMRQVINPTSGYPSVSLYIDGNRKQMMVHWAVMRAFVGPTPEGQEIRHLDGDAGNPRQSNLCFGTKLINEADKKVHGTFKPPPVMRGMANGNSKISPEKWRVIRFRALAGETAGQLAEEFGVSKAAVYKRSLDEQWGLPRGNRGRKRKNK